MSREKKPHDWPVSAGGSEIRPHRGLRTRMEANSSAIHVRWSAGFRRKRIKSARQVESGLLR